jgi:endonuclease YncB( thermonuclease family)
MQNNNDNLMCSNCDIPEFSLNGLSCWAKIVYVYDGDTVHIVIKFNDVLTRFNCRLFGIDTKEMKSTNITDKEIAIQARNYLINKLNCVDVDLNNINKNNIKDLCANSKKLVWVNCLEFDKYGRLLIEIKDTPQSTKTYNQELIDLGLAYAYYGGTKN